MPVNIGTDPNDGTGDTLRTAFGILNVNDRIHDDRAQLGDTIVLSAAAGSTANAVIATKDVAQADLTIDNGKLVSIYWPTTNTGTSPTINVDGTTFAVRRRSGSQVEVGELVGSQWYLLQRNASQLRLVSASGISDIAGLSDALWESSLNFRGRFARMQSLMLHGATVRVTGFGDSLIDGNGSSGWTPNPVDGSGNAIGSAPHLPPNAWPQMAQNAIRSMFGNSNIYFHNAGYSGRQLQTGWALSNFDAAVLGPYPVPDAVIVSFGVNDVRQTYFDPATFEAQLLLLCRRIDQAGAFPIFLLPDQPSAEQHTGWKLGKVNAIYRSVAERIGVQVIDWGTAMIELSQCSDGTIWRWGADQPDDTHGNDTLHSIKGGFIAASIYPHTLWVNQAITDIAPWSRYCKPIPGYSVYQGTMNKFGGAMIVPAGGYATDQFLLDIWVWSVGAARAMYWAAVDANNYLSPRTVANAPRIGLYDYVSKTTQTITAPTSGAAQGPDGGRDGEAFGRVFRVPQGLSRWAFRAPRDNNASDVYLGYFSIREVQPLYAAATPVFAPAATPTIIDRDSEGDLPQVFGIQHGRTLNLALTVDLPAGMGVCLWSSRVYGGSVTRESNRKRGLFLFRHADGRLFLHHVVFNADGTIGTSASLGSSAVLTWAGARQLRIEGGVDGSGQYIRVYDGWSSTTAIITATNALTNAPLPWGGTPGAIWQLTGSTGVAALTIYGDV